MSNNRKEIPPSLNVSISIELPVVQVTETKDPAENAGLLNTTPKKPKYGSLFAKEEQQSQKESKKDSKPMKKYQKFLSD